MLVLDRKALGIFNERPNTGSGMRGSLTTAARLCRHGNSSKCAEEDEFLRRDSFGDCECVV
jgi:hypothetical protein